MSQFCSPLSYDDELFESSKQYPFVFNSKTFANYETILFGNNISSVHGSLEHMPEQEALVMGGINSALNENYDELKGSMKKGLDSLVPYVVK